MYKEAKARKWKGLLLDALIRGTGRYTKLPVYQVHNLLDLAERLLRKDFKGATRYFQNMKDGYGTPNYIIMMLEG